VAVVARRHAINANLVFGWRRLYQQGLLTETEPAKAPPLLPVKVVTPTVVPSERSKPAPSPAAPPISKSSSIEIEFTSGQKLRIHGRLDRVLLMRLVRVLSRR
jgi:transposase-like protein